MNATQRDSDSSGLSEGSMAADPMTQFARWMSDAQALVRPEPTAMVLATTAADGRPRARTVLLKGHDQTGFTFYTNRTSRKGRDIAANPRACVVFPWYALQRQVTAEGSVVTMSREDSEPYFRSRPYGSQIGAWASRQSQVIGSRDELDRRVEELEQRWPPTTCVTMTAGPSSGSLPESPRVCARRASPRHCLLGIASQAGG